MESSSSIQGLQAKRRTHQVWFLQVKNLLRDHH